MPSGTWGAVLVLVEVTLFGSAVVWCALNLRRLGTFGTWAGRRLHLLPTPPPAAAGMPIERIAADLRRIRPQALRPASGTPYTRRLATVAAYDDALLDACRALGVPTELDRITDALERESERMRAEHELEKAGVHLG